MNSTTLRVVGGIVLAATLVTSLYSLRLQAQREAEWSMRLESLLAEFHTALRGQGEPAPRPTLNGPASAATRSLAGQIADNSRRLDQLSEELEAVKGLLARVGSPEGTVADAGFAEPQVPKEEIALRRQLARETRQRDALDAFRSQKVDSAWAEGMGSAITGMLNDQEARGISIPEFDCRSSSCEVYWAIDDNLTDQERFERDNHILAYMASIGLNKVTYLEAASPGEFRAIFSAPDRR